MSAPTIPDWPSYTDDDGITDNGTDITAAFIDSLGNAIQAAITGEDNPTVYAQTIIDEVIAARGGFSDLDARLDEPAVGTIYPGENVSDIIDEVVIARDDNPDLNDRLDNFVADEIPDADATTRGLVNFDAQTFAGLKQFNTQPTALPGGAASGVITMQGTLAADITAHIGSAPNVETDASIFILPANFFNANGRGIRFTGWGKSASTTVKTFQIYWDGTLIYDPATWNTASWFMFDVIILRRASGVQLVRANFRVGPGSSGGINTATPVTAAVNQFTIWDGTAPTEADETGAITFKTTVKDATTAANITQIACVAEVL